MQYFKSIFFIFATGLFCLSINTAFANQVASIAVTNLSSQDLKLKCKVLEGTRFYHDFDFSEKSRLFEFSSYESKHIQNKSIDIENIHGNTLTLHCHQENFPENNFKYHSINDEENAEVNGRFEYDPSYPGSFVFKDFT